jgi:hypothetical protein
MPVPRQSPTPSRPAPGCAERCCGRRQELRTGDIFRIGRRASVQFAGERGLIFRMISVDRRPCPHGWVWLTGYELGQHGEAVAKREIFVQLSGLHPLWPRPASNQPDRYPTPGQSGATK